MGQRLRTVLSHGLHAPQLTAANKCGPAAGAEVIFQTASWFVMHVGKMLVSAASFVAAVKRELNGSICIVAKHVSACSHQNSYMSLYTRKASTT